MGIGYEKVKMNGQTVRALKVAIMGDDVNLVDISTGQRYEIFSIKGSGEFVLVDSAKNVVNPMTVSAEVQEQMSEYISWSAMLDDSYEENLAAIA